MVSTTSFENAKETSIEIETNRSPEPSYVNGAAASVRELLT